MNFILTHIAAISILSNLKAGSCQTVEHLIERLTAYLNFLNYYQNTGIDLFPPLF